MTLIDTSSLVHFLRKKGDQKVKNRLQEILLRGEGALCDMVVVELWMGIGSREDERDVTELTGMLPLLPTDQPVWTLARKLALTCRKNGSPVPSSDALIAACAFTHQAELDYEDKHFLVLEQLRPRGK